jgi:hypothetical protein
MLSLAFLLLLALILSACQMTAPNTNPNPPAATAPAVTAPVTTPAGEQPVVTPGEVEPTSEQAVVPSTPVETAAPGQGEVQAGATLTGTRTFIPQVPSEIGQTPSQTGTLTTTLATQPKFQYSVQAGTPVAVANFVREDAGCNWMGVAGQVFGKDENPVTGLVVEVGGKLEGNDVLGLALTGGSQTLGSGGYQIDLADHPVESKGTMFLQLFDLSGNPLSEVVPLQTYADCDRNMVVVNFVGTGYSGKIYFPTISR